MKSSWLVPTLCTASLLLAAASWHSAHAADPATQPRSSDNDAIRHELLKEKERTLTHIVGYQSRIDETQKQIAILDDTLQKEIASDKSIRGYLLGCQQRENRLKLLQTGQTTNSPDDIANTILNIADINKLIAERADHIRDETHGTVYNELCRTQTLANIDLHAAQSQLNSINARLSQLP